MSDPRDEAHPGWTPYLPATVERIRRGLDSFNARETAKAMAFPEGYMSPPCAPFTAAKVDGSTFMAELMAEARLIGQAKRDRTIRRRRLAIIAAVSATIIALLVGQDIGRTEPGTIGANTVPIVHCQEDEVIGFVNDGHPPFDLGCVHIDDVNAQVVDYQDETRPVCFVEPVDTLPEGVEIIWYPHLYMKQDSTRGLEILCPEGTR